MISDTIKKMLLEKKTIVILPHIIPDGDTLGSSVALFHALKQLGHDLYIVIEDEIPSNLKFLPYKNVFYLENYNNLKVIPDLIITIDASDIERLGQRKIILNSCNTIMNIDHHKTNSRFGIFNIVDMKAAACGEIIYRIITDLEIEINKEIATCLYVAISTDTGSFKYSNTTPTTLRIAAELLEAGIDNNYINIELYQNKPLNKIKLLSNALNTLEIHFDGKLAIMNITLDMLYKNKIKITDLDGIIEYIRDIEGVEIAVLLKEISPNEIKVGLRSKHDFDVSIIAKNFGGGGHKNASGCLLKDDINNVKQKLISVIEKNLR